MAMEKAEIQSAENPANQTYTVMFNPPELKITSSNSYADTKSPGDSKEKKQFVGKNNDTMTVVLFFDCTRKGSEEYQKAIESKKGIRYATDPIIELAKIPKNKKVPPMLVFAWGEEFFFPCVILSIDQKYEFFDSAGNPLRAELTIKFQRHEPAEPYAAAAKKAKKLKMQKILEGMDHTSLSENKTEWRKEELFASGSCDPMTFQNGSMVGTIIG